MERDLSHIRLPNNTVADATHHGLVVAMAAEGVIQWQTFSNSSKP